MCFTASFMAKMLQKQIFGIVQFSRKKSIFRNKKKSINETRAETALFSEISLPFIL